VQQFEADEEISYANNVLLTKKKDARKKYDAGSAPETLKSESSLLTTYWSESTLSS